MQSLQDDLDKEQSGKEAAEKRVQAWEAQLSEEYEKTRQAKAICKSLQESLSLNESEIAGLEKSEVALGAANKRAQQLEGLLAQVKNNQADQQVSISDVFFCMHVVRSMAAHGRSCRLASTCAQLLVSCGYTHCRACCKLVPY